MKWRLCKAVRSAAKGRHDIKLPENRASRIADLLVLSILLASTAIAQSPGTFIPTGSMTTPRFLHTATLLADGRVLIAGGQRIDPPAVFTTLSSAEIYDPRTGTFTATGNMTTARSRHTATLLPNGKVLIAGGADDSSAELYDPNTGTFTLTGNMIAGGLGGILLPNGKVFFVGEELYDPSTGTFTATGHGILDSADTVTLLPNGKVLITAGNPEGPPPFLSSAELYDPSTGTFASAGYLNQNHTGPTATLLANGKVLIAGGDWGDGDGASYIAELYDPATGTFTVTGNMINGHEQNTATLLADGTVLMAGGHEGLVKAEIYNPVNGIFTGTGNMSGRRELHTATLLNDGRVLIAGGDNEIYWSPQTILATAELYVPPLPDQWLQAITAMKTGAGTDSYNFWQWAWFWQRSPAFPGAPASFGVLGSIDNTPGLMGEIIAAGGGNGSQSISAEQWVAYYHQVIATDPWQQAIARMQAAAGTNSLNFWQWAWYWQRSPMFAGAPAGFGVLGSIDNTPGAIFKIIAAGGGNGLAAISAEQWVLYYRGSSTVVSGVVNAASHLAGAIAPGELVVVTGSGLGPAQAVLAAPDSHGLYAAQLAGTTVLVNGTPVPLIYTSATQVEAVVPDSIAGGTAQVTVTYQGQTSASFPVPVAPAAPGIFTADSTGQGRADSFNQNGRINTPAHGATLLLYS